MLLTDPIGDYLTRIRNAAMVNHREVKVPHSKLKQAIAEVLKKEGYLDEVARNGNELVIALAFKNRKPVITGIKNVTRPGTRIYRKATNLPRPLGGAGISVVSTSKGVMSNKEAREKKLGGEVIGEVW